MSMRLYRIPHASMAVENANRASTCIRVATSLFPSDKTDGTMMLRRVATKAALLHNPYGKRIEERRREQESKYRITA